MQYRDFGKTREKVSILGFGCMRYPMAGKDIIDEKETIKMLHYAIDKGINYFDTAYVYHGGKSETILSKALQGGLRQKVKIATKLPVWSVNETDDFDKFLDEQLTRLSVDHIDYYLLHSLGKDSWDKALRLDLLKKAEDAQKSGKISKIGFSFHDNYDSFQKIIDDYPKWDFCQIQYNYMNIDEQAGQKGLQYAASKGIGIVIMEPLLGGRLANPPQKVRSIFNDYEKQHTPADWSLQWLWNQKEVHVVLSGMSSMEQLEQNLKAADQAGINSFDENDHKFIQRVQAGFIERVPIPCTQCQYCMPCPEGVGIPRNIDLYNSGVVYEEMGGARYAYKHFFGDKERAESCIQCRICEDKCPQKIEISQWMPKIHAAVAEKVEA